VDHFICYKENSFKILKTELLETDRQTERERERERKRERQNNRRMVV